jgi:predicted nucleic-acid-binding Zn-ribbon protein
VTNQITKNGVTKRVTTAKSTIKGKEQDTTIYQTIDGKYAPLQLKWIQESGKFEFVHVDCLECLDNGKNEWKRSSGLPLRKFFDVTHETAGAWKIHCRQCGRKWRSDASNRYLM